MRESSNNFSPSQAGEFCLDHIQGMTVFESSDMSSALAQESSSSREEMAFPYFHCKKMYGLWHGGGTIQDVGGSGVSYRSLSFSFKNHSKLSKGQHAAFAHLSLRFRCLGELFARVLLALCCCVRKNMFGLGAKKFQFLFR